MPAEVGTMAAVAAWLVGSARSTGGEARSTGGEARGTAYASLQPLAMRRRREAARLMASMSESPSLPARRLTSQRTVVHAFLSTLMSSETCLAMRTNESQRGTVVSGDTDSSAATITSRTVAQ
jgi:hypothetical protein